MTHYYTYDGINLIREEWANNGSIDITSVALSALQWGAINTAGAFLCSIPGPLNNFESGMLSGIFGSATSSIGMTIDILRNRRK